MRDTATVQFIGKRGSGKSTLIKDILYHNRDKFRFGIGMSPTDEATNDMASIMPRSCIYNTFEESAIETMLETQRMSVKKHPERKNNMFCVIDDCAYDSKAFRTKAIRESFMNGRHRKMFVMNAVQYMMDMPANLRGQIDYIFAMQDTNHDQKEKLWKYFFGIFPDYKSFNTVFESCTEGFGCIVMDTTVRSNKIDDCVFHYKANPNLPSFRLCDDVFWNLDKRYYSDRDTPDIEQQGLVVTLKH
jgi:molybdopterin-guanine dinucleotide biosynthesis protein